MRMICETAEGIKVSDGRGWREPFPGEHLKDGHGNYLPLNQEQANVAWAHGFIAGVLVSLGVLLIIGVVAAA